MPDGGKNSFEDDQRVLRKIAEVFGKSQTTGSLHRFFIELVGHRYEVAKIGEIRAVKAFGEWMSGEAFVDRLIDRGDYDQVCELAIHGYRILKENS